jgi:16S rRNA (uracil1498-N3)-methyltransferase
MKTGFYNSTMVPRFFCSLPLNAGQAVTLPVDVAHHAERVLRLRAGDAVVLFNGNGGEYPARIETLGRVSRVRLEAWQPIERESPLAIRLAQAMPAADKMDWIVQKSVELGVAAIAPVVSSRSIVRLSGERAAKRIDHLRRLAIAACEQCGRNRVPPVDDLLPLPQFLATQAELPGPKLMLSPCAPVRLSELPSPNSALTLLVGPEGGFTDEELRAARACGFQPAALGPRVLRTETAGLAALAGLLARWGDF